MCKVSVLIPAYNAEPYLAECLDSVCGQTLSDIEIICIDDGSTDRTPDILRTYAARDQRIRVISQANAGYGRAVNVGMRAARGEYIGIVEADDYVSAKMYEKLWRIAKRHTLDFVKADYSYFKGSCGNRVFDRIMICPRLSWYCKKLCPRKTPMLLDVDLMNVTGIYRRSFLQTENIFLQETPGAAYQDTGLWFQIFLKAQSCMFLPYSLYHIRRDNPSSSVFQSGRFYMICQEYERITRQLTAMPDQYRLFAAQLFKRKVSAYLFILGKLEDKRESMQWFSQEIREARCRGEYDEALFTETVNQFLRQTESWDGQSAPPVYQKSGSPWTRAADCLKEHGSAYTIRRLLIKAGLRREVF